MHVKKIFFVQLYNYYASDNQDKDKIKKLKMKVMPSGSQQILFYQKYILLAI